MNKNEEKEIMLDENALEELQNEEVIVAYCCCGNQRTRSTGNSNSASGC